MMLAPLRVLISAAVAQRCAKHAEASGNLPLHGEGTTKRGSGHCSQLDFMSQTPE